MQWMERFEEWRGRHDGGIGLALVRVYLGVALLVRGALFISDHTAVTEMVRDAGTDWYLPMMMVHYVAVAHLVGGLFLAIGLLTRVAAIVQIPILFVAVFFIHFQDGLLAAGQSLELSALVLFLLIVFAVFGGGRYSLDHHFFSKERQANMSEPVV